MCKDSESCMQCEKNELVYFLALLNRLHSYSNIVKIVSIAKNGKMNLSIFH